MIFKHLLKKVILEGGKDMAFVIVPTSTNFLIVTCYRLFLSAKDKIRDLIVIGKTNLFLAPGGNVEEVSGRRRLAELDELLRIKGLYLAF